MKASDAQRLVTLADAQDHMPKLREALRTKRKPGYDRVALLIGIHQIDEGTGSEEVDSIEIDLKTAEIVLQRVSEVISTSLDLLGYERE